MPHSRYRYLEPQIKKALKHASIVGILGHRQTGKTTLSEALSAEYVTLDAASTLDFARASPAEFLMGHQTPYCVDECQLAPELFPALKEHVRIHKRPGQFLLTGSVKFTSRKAIRESLTGRLFQLELLPMTHQEANSKPLSNRPLQLIEAGSVETFLKKKSSSTPLSSIVAYLESGGLPGICFFRESSIRQGKFRSHLDTVLTRDLRLIHATNLPQAVLISLLKELAYSQGEPVDISKLSRKVRISVKTIPLLIEAMQSLFLLRIFETEGGTKRPVIYFEDQGLASYLGATGLDSPSGLLRSTYSLFYPVFHYQFEMHFRLYRYHTRGGACVPLAFETKKGTLGVIPSLGETPTPSEFASARSFLKAVKNAKVLILTVGGSKKRGASPRTPTVIEDRILLDRLENWVG
jgi:predicted AAA+ superfamily ATPase